MYGAVWCSVLQCIAVCCSALHCFVVAKRQGFSNMTDICVWCTPLIYVTRRNYALDVQPSFFSRVIYQCERDLSHSSACTRRECT